MLPNKLIRVGNFIGRKETRKTQKGLFSSTTKNHKDLIWLHVANDEKLTHFNQ